MAIYFIQSGDYVKIGYSKNPEKRLKSLQTGNQAPLKLLLVLDGGTDKEAELHERFAELRSRGEWFYHSNDLAHFIDNPNGRSEPDLEMLTVREMIDSSTIPSMNKYLVNCVACEEGEEKRAVEYLLFNGDFETENDGLVYGGVIPVCEEHVKTASTLNPEVIEWWMKWYYNNWQEPDEE